MSEFSDTKSIRLAKLLEVSRMVIETGNARPFILANPGFTETVVPSDFITLFDVLVKEGYDTETLKTCANKILNIFHLSIASYPKVEPDTGTFLSILEKNNQQMEQLLDRIRQFLKNNRNINPVKPELLSHFEELEKFTAYYTIKENVLFPAIEKAWPDYRCLQIMWSFHDDIRKNIRYVLERLKNGIDDEKTFNRKVGDIFFNMLAIKFREERILFPVILTTISEEQLEALNHEGAEIGYPYFQPETMAAHHAETGTKTGIDLGTGLLSIEQIKLIFNHLPIDITFVDEDDTVRYFSTPKKRIFTRTKAIIGRKVTNCHPPESVHVVEKIIQSFRNGEKDQASFWIKMKGEYVLIQYFAVRDEAGNYKGIIEVTQEITDIKALEGEKRLLDWD